MTNHRVLNLEEHRDLRVRTEPSAEMGDGVMACITVPYEFRQVQRSYPIVFRRDPETDAFSALALFGFTNGENLFLEEGTWDSPYRPIAQSIQPFLVGRPANGQGEGQVHVDMDHPRISKDDEGIRVFDEDGSNTPYLDDIAQKLGFLHEGYEASTDFYDALKQYELIEPFTLNVDLVDGSQHSLVGFQTIHEEKLQALGAQELGDLHQRGHLMPIFMVLASMVHFGDLIERKNKRVGGG